jgi:AraC-like DNA-binding protein
MAYIYRYPPGAKHGSGWLKLEPYFTLPKEGFFAHGHAFAELTLVMVGKGRHRYAGRTHLTQAGDLLFCPPGLVHQFFNSAGQTHRNIHFDPSLLESLKREARDLRLLHELFPSTGAPSKHLRLLPKELSLVEQLLRELDAEQQEARPGRQTALRLLFHRLLLLLARFAERRQSQRVDGRIPGGRGLAVAYQALRQKPSQPHNLASLAALSGHSASHFRRLFRQAYGESPIHLLIRERLRLACGLLENGDLSITELAVECGFEDGNYFARQFKKLMGTSPLRYRKTFRAGRG